MIFSGSVWDREISCITKVVMMMMVEISPRSAGTSLMERLLYCRRREFREYSLSLSRGDKIGGLPMRMCKYL